MQDLNYIISLGFSGADLPRAIILAFFLSMMFAARRSIWALGLIALIIDIAAWPLIEQALSGAKLSTVMSSFSALLSGVGDNVGIYVVRYMGLVVMIGLFNEARVRLHHLAPPKKAAA